MLLEPTGDLQRTLRRVLDTQSECLQPLDNEEAIRRAKASTDVTKPFYTSSDDEGRWPEGLAVAQAMVPWAGLGEVGELPIRPIELPRVDDSTTHRSTIAREVLRQRIDHDICSVIDRTAEDRRQGIVHHERQAVCMGHICHRSDIDEVELRIAKRLGVHELRIGLDRSFEGLRIVCIDEGRRDPEAGKGDAQEIVRTPIDARRSHDMIART